MVKTVDQEGVLPVWDKPVEVDKKWIQFVDDNVLICELPSMEPRYSTKVADLRRITAKL